MITIEKSKQKTKDNTIIDPNNNVLIIGSANTNINVNKIMYYTKSIVVSNTYGDCRLSRSFDILSHIGVKDIFVMNIKVPYETDYIADLLTQYNFAYVVFTDIYFSSRFSTHNKTDLEISFAGALLERCGENVTSICLFTDKHASLYEDLDSYLEDMFQAYYFMKKKNYNYNKRNLIFVLNNLQDYELSHVVLAGILASSTIGEYPIYDYGPAIFDIIDTDIGSKEIIFFQNNYLKNTSVENMLNFYDYRSPLKIVFIDRIVKYIKRAIDLSYFKGKLYTPYQKSIIEDDANKILTSMVPDILTDYHIKKINVEYFTDCTVEITITIDVWIKGCLEKITIILD